MAKGTVKVIFGSTKQYVGDRDDIEERVSFDNEIIKDCLSGKNQSSVQLPLEPHQGERATHKAPPHT